MNERIRELWNQSRYPSGRSHDEQKFAELIVRECVGIVELEAKQYTEPTWAFEIVNDIKEHFGVEA
jgi:hypothetical protein